MSLMDLFLVLIGVLLASVAPVIIGRYLLSVLPRRCAEIEAIFWGKDAEKLYARLFLPERDQKLAATDQFWRLNKRGDYLRALSLVFGLTIFLLFAGLQWVKAHLNGAQDVIGSLPIEVVMALAGAYVWSVYETFSRARSANLVPDDLYEVALRLIAAVPIGYAASLLVADAVHAAAAFGISAFPLRDVRLLINERIIRRAGVRSRFTETSVSGQGYLGNIVPGMSDRSIARLQELNITTYVDLAYADPIKIMAQTGFGLRQVLTWIDRSLLVVYAGDLHRKFAAAGIPCALDVNELFKWYCDKRHYHPNHPTIVALVAHLGISEPLILDLFHRIHIDPHVRLLAKLWYVKPAPESAQVVRASGV